MSLHDFCSILVVSSVLLSLTCIYFNCFKGCDCVSLLCPSLFLVFLPSAWFTRVMGEPSHDGKEGDIIMGDGSEHVSKGICTEDGGINANKTGEKPSYKQILADSSPIFSASAEFDGIFRRIPMEIECGGARGNGG